MQNVKSCVNRFNVRLTVGDLVRFPLPRGGHSYGRIVSFDFSSDYAKAYGAQVAFVGGGYSCTIHDCAIASLPSLLARNPACVTETLSTGAIAFYATDRLSADDQWELHHLADYAVSSIGSGNVAILCPR